MSTEVNYNRTFKNTTHNFFKNKGGSPYLVVMGGYSCSKGCQFKSQHHILDVHFSHTYLL